MATAAKTLIPRVSPPSWFDSFSVRRHHDADRYCGLSARQRGQADPLLEDRRWSDPRRYPPTGARRPREIGWHAGSIHPTHIVAKKGASGVVIHHSQTGALQSFVVWRRGGIVKRRRRTTIAILTSRPVAPPASPQPHPRARIKAEKEKRRQVGASRRAIVMLEHYPVAKTRSSTLWRISRIL